MQEEENERGLLQVINETVIHSQIISQSLVVVLFEISTWGCHFDCRTHEFGFDFTRSLSPSFSLSLIFLLSVNEEKQF